jgi:hypothetical protein
MGALIVNLSTGCLPGAPNENMTVADMSATIDAPPNLTAEQMFNQDVLPLLTPTCGACHSLVSGIGPGFLASASSNPNIYDPYPTIIAWPNFIVTNPELSLLITKGQHEGPAMTESQYNETLAWLQLVNQENAASAVTPFAPQVPPFSLVFTTNMAMPQYNVVQLSQIDPSLVGAYIRFIATTLNSDGSGLEISDLRLINVVPNPQPNQQRSIEFNSPLFVLWRNGVPFPDPANSFQGTDDTVALNQNDPGATGVLIIPGVLFLDEYQPGYSLSIVFSSIAVVPPVIGSNPCTTNQMNYLTTNIVPYLAAASSCTQAGKCHNATNMEAGLNLSPVTMTGADLTSICEQLWFYNGLGTIAQNTDPNSTLTHPFKWDAPDCMANGFPTTCFTTFSGFLTTWQTIQ